MFQIMTEEFTVQLSPEHLRLTDYLADNPSPPSPLVGLEHITEFTHSRAKRPYYHCSLPGCYNEQGQIGSDQIRSVGNIMCGAGHWKTDDGAPGGETPRHHVAGREGF